MLDATYGARLHAAVLNAEGKDHRTVFLTSLGGGAFGNELSWIVAAIERAVRVFTDANLDVVIVSRGAPSEELQTIVAPPQS